MKIAGFKRRKILAYGVLFGLMSANAVVLAEYIGLHHGNLEESKLDFEITVLHKKICGQEIRAEELEKCGLPPQKLIEECAYYQSTSAHIIFGLHCNDDRFSVVRGNVVPYYEWKLRKILVENL